MKSRKNKENLTIYRKKTSQSTFKGKVMSLLRACMDFTYIKL